MLCTFLLGHHGDPREGLLPLRENRPPVSLLIVNTLNMTKRGKQVIQKNCSGANQET